MFDSIFGEEIETILVTDSKNIYQQCNSSTKITDPHASLDIANIRAHLETGAISHLSWVKSEYMLADTLTKSKANFTIISRVLAEGKIPFMDFWPNV